MPLPHRASQTQGQSQQPDEAGHSPLRLPRPRLPRNAPTNTWDGGLAEVLSAPRQQACPQAAAPRTTSPPPARPAEDPADTNSPQVVSEAPTNTTGLQVASDRALAEAIQARLWEEADDGERTADASHAPRRAVSRGPALTAEEWGGGLGDVLPVRSYGGGGVPSSHRSQGGGSNQAHGSAMGPRPRRRAPESDAGSSPSYEELMSMHLRDNGPERAEEAWRQVIALFKPVSRSSKPKGDADAGGEPAACCSICLDPLIEARRAQGVHRHALRAQPVCELPCGHQFHKRCITDCVKQGHSCCPNCRYDLLSNRPAVCGDPE